MNSGAERHRMRTESYQTDLDTGAVDDALDEFFHGLDSREGLDLLESEDGSDDDSREYSFQAGNSSVGVVYQINGSESSTSVDIEFYGAGPAVDRLYSSFSKKAPGQIH